MVIVDSSVWIDLLKGRETKETIAFERLVAEDNIALGDLILYEVLRGVTPITQAEKVKAHLLTFPVFTMGGCDMVLEAVHNTRILQSKGFQAHLVDSMIATLCIVSGSRLLTSDRHFLPFADELGLMLATELRQQ